MKLYEYAIELANGIAGAEQTRDHNITITLLPEHMAYRKVIASVIYNQFTSQSAREVLSNVVLEHEALCRTLEMVRKENADLLAKLEGLEKPKAVEAEQDKLDAAMQGLRKRRAEKKAAQKAKKGE